MIHDQWKSLKKAIRNAVNTIDDKFNFNGISTVSESNLNLALLAKDEHSENIVQ